MACRRRKRTITELLDLRSKGLSDVGALARLNLKILRAVILQDQRKYTKVWSKTSKSTIVYENERIYFEKLRICYSSIHSEPQILYMLAKCSKMEKIETALLCQSPLNKALPNPSDHKPCLLALTAGNWLYRIAAETGDVLQRIYLSPHVKFIHIGWDVLQETLYLKSVQNKGTSSAGQSSLNRDTLLHLAIFHVFPFEIVGILAITKTVFGNSITDAVLSEGVLCVSHSTKLIKLYSCEHILKRYITTKLTLGEQSSFNGGKRVGEVPLGIPVNIHLKDCPPVLFVVSCSDYSVQIGGCPWHYIYTPPHKKHKGTHHICSLEDGILAINGIQEMDGCSLESDQIFFHHDDSGRIIHVGPSTINVLKILKGLKNGIPSEVVLDFSIAAHRDISAASQVTVTSSGRTVKRRIQQLDDDPELETFHLVEYEDELDLLAVLVTNSEEGEVRAHIKLYDNKSGDLVKTVSLDEYWDETYRHCVSINRDTIVHLTEKKNTFSCYVYKLQNNRI